MAVETYIQEEMQDVVIDNDSLQRWNELIEKLGLEKQKELVSGEKSPVPFPLLNKGMENVYRVLCPRSRILEEYNAQAIPVRVLETLALCKQENYFHKIEIWSDESAPDPIAVGFLNSESSSPKYILARWGDELCSFVELKQRAIERQIVKKTAAIKREITKLQGNLESIESMAATEMEGEWVYYGA